MTEAAETTRHQQSTDRQTLLIEWVGSKISPAFRLTDRLTSNIIVTFSLHLKTRTDDHINNQHHKSISVASPLVCNIFDTMARSFIALFLVAALAASANAFTVGPRSVSQTTSSTSLNIFGNALKDAFGNDDKLGKAKNEGLSGGPDYNEKVTVNGMPVKGAVVGQKLTVVAGRVRVKVSAVQDCDETSKFPRTRCRSYLLFIPYSLYDLKQ
jgi:hypothetical protein